MYSGLLDVSPIQCLYLHSNLSNFDSVGPLPSSSQVIARIPVLSNYGLVLHHVGLVDTAFPVDVRNINNITVRLTDSKGKVINSRGSACSLEIIFLPT
jgi:hypothetical protein